MSSPALLTPRRDAVGCYVLPSSCLFAACKQMEMPSWVQADPRAGPGQGRQWGRELRRGSCGTDLPWLLGQGWHCSHVLCRSQQTLRAFPLRAWQPARLGQEQMPGAWLPPATPATGPHSHAPMGAGGQGKERHPWQSPGTALVWLHGHGGTAGCSSRPVRHRVPMREGCEGSKGWRKIPAPPAQPGCFLGDKPGTGRGGRRLDPGGFTFPSAILLVNGAVRPFPRHQ